MINPSFNNDRPGPWNTSKSIYLTTRWEIGLKSGWSSSIWAIKSPPMHEKVSTRIDLDSAVNHSASALAPLLWFNSAPGCSGCRIELCGAPAGRTGRGQSSGESSRVSHRINLIKNRFQSGMMHFNEISLFILWCDEPAKRLWDDPPPSDSQREARITALLSLISAACRLMTGQCLSVSSVSQRDSFL